MIVNEKIDGGKGFDWGRTSTDYAKYRDIYPEEFYDFLLSRDICTKGQKVLDIGTGTGVLPRNMYRHGAEFTGIDISENQIEQAKILAREGGMNINFICTPAEQIEFPMEAFDVVTACQCFTYFDHSVLSGIISRALKKGGRFVVLYMAWLSYEDIVAGKSEELVLKYNPGWSGCGEVRHYIEIPEVYKQYFVEEDKEIFDVKVPFTRESWNGRMKACRGIGASLSDGEIADFEKQHMEMLEAAASEKFEVLHYVAASVLRKK